MAQAKLSRKPQRWDKAFGPGRLRADIVTKLLSGPVFCAVDPRNFPVDLSLEDIIANDARIHRYGRGEIIFGKGEYGSSLFVVLVGSVRTLLFDRSEDALIKHTDDGLKKSSLGIADLASIFKRNGGSKAPITQIPNLDAFLEEHPAQIIHTGEIFGEAEALLRTPRHNTHFAAEDKTFVLEIRWAGVRELRHWSDPFRHMMDGIYKTRAFHRALRELDLLKKLGPKTQALIARHARYQTCGRLDWAHEYKRHIEANGTTSQVITEEPLIAEAGHYLDDVIIIHSGFARVSTRVDHGEKNIACLLKNGVFGLDDVTRSLTSSAPRVYRNTLRAIGHTALLKIPAAIAEAHIVPELLKEEDAETPNQGRKTRSQEKTGKVPASVPQTTLDFAIDHRFVNGREAMAISTDRCVNCDDCVRACASTHNNVPRFVRNGPKQQNLMVANACMHCADPTCLIGCPTGAIAREKISGAVVVDAETCIGCATCAENCPYGNISMQPARSPGGSLLIDADGTEILKAVKCDLCAGVQGGPACQRACPHDALIRVDIQDMGKLATWVARKN